MKTFLATVAGLSLTLGLTSAASAATRVGVLRCYVENGAGYVVGSAHLARCSFTSETGRRERYRGIIKRVGLDVGYTGRAVIVWAVFAPSDLRRHALTGDYVGASADLAVGIGGGGNVLVGGNRRTVSLQPVSFKTETGLAVAVGAAELELR
jgi:hypothetical protein